MGIHIWCNEITYREAYSGFMSLRCIACSATLIYLRDLAGKQPAERARNILTVPVGDMDDTDELDTITDEIIQGGVTSVEAMCKDRRICDDAAGDAMWRRHQILANLGLSGLVDLVFHSDSDGYYTAGMATDILAWWTRVGPFYRQAVEQFVGEIPSESDMQERLDSIAKRFCTGARVAVKMNQGADVVSGGIARMDELIAVFREVVETGTHAHVC